MESAGYIWTKYVWAGANGKFVCLFVSLVDMSCVKSIIVRYFAIYQYCQHNMHAILLSEFIVIELC